MMILSNKFALPVHNSSILSVSSLGVMKVTIEDLNKLGLSVHNLNSSNVDIYIIPSEENTNYTTVNFTWEVEKIEENLIVI